MSKGKNFLTLNEDNTTNTTINDEVITDTQELEPNLASLNSYLLLGIGGIIFLLIEKENKQVRFDAAQSIVLSVSIILTMLLYSLISLALKQIPFWIIIDSLVTIFFVATVALIWVILMIRSYQGKRTELPLIGRLAEKLLNFF